MQISIKRALFLGWLAFLASGLAKAQQYPAQSPPAAGPAEMISRFRTEHGEGRVMLDPALTRVAHDQAAAMAAKDVLDHDVLGAFGARIASAGFGRAAENIAYGYDSFPKTLNQWIESSGHRKNLLLHDASRVGVASVKSAKTGRTYWAMEIGGDPDRPKEPAKGLAKNSTRNASKQAATKPVPAPKPKPSAPTECRLKILSLCL